MSKIAARLKGAKKAAGDKIHHGKLRTDIPAGLAAGSPPLGPMLGERGINIAAFCKDFNERTENMREGIPLPCRVRVNPDRSYELVIHKPPVTFFLKQAAGIEKGAMYTGKEVAGKVSLRHVYEIAKIKSEDPPLQTMTMEQLCLMVVGIARSCGIEVVRDLNANEYKQFLADRQVVIEEQKKELQLKRDAKMSRITT